MNSEYNLHLEVDIRKKLKGFSLDISFETGRGCLGILGPSGCGKSMTLKSIAGIIRPDQGRIALRYAQGEAAGGRVLYDSALKINERPQVRRVGYLFQNYALFPGMTVEQNIMVGLKGGRGNVGLRRRRPMSREAGEQKVSEMVERFRLHGLEKRYPGQLSGGQQQRVALARSLAYEPEALLLDEPFSAMDTYLREGLRLELAGALKEYDGVTIMVTHDRDEAYQLCDNLLLMDRGCVLAYPGLNVWENAGYGPWTGMAWSWPRTVPWVTPSHTWASGPMILNPCQRAAPGLIWSGKTQIL